LSVSNIYVGANSCYARREGIYVPAALPWREKAVRIIQLIIRDLQRGWSYDHDCNPMPFTVEHARDRLRYLVALTKRHDPASYEHIRSLVRSVLQRFGGKRAVIVVA